jgi:hypothetical protein
MPPLRFYKINHTFRIVFLTCLFGMSLSTAWSQSNPSTEFDRKGQQKSSGAEGGPYHRISVGLAHAHIPAEIDLPGRKNLVIPAWNFDYDYWLNERFAIGLHNTLFLQQFSIEKRSDNTELLRSNPVSSSLVALYRPGKRWVFVGGLGREFEKNESFNLLDLGIEYGIELPGEWELSAGLKYENKFSAYDSWLLGLGVSKKFGQKK